MANVTLRKVVKRFGDVETIHGVDLDIAHREFAIFVGPSGCGKSTLLRMIAGLEEISDGDLLIDGKRVNDVDCAKRGCAMVFQSYALYPHMTVAENMGFALKIGKVDRKTIDEKVMRAAKILKLDHMLDRKPKNMSGGQRQRVAIGRCIVREPKVFLFDEPLSNLDAELRVQMRVEISKLHQQLDATMIYVTHDQVEAMTMADKIVVLRDGRIEQVGSPLELYEHPQNQFVAGFIGSPKMNFIDTRIDKLEDGRVTVDLPGKGSLKLPLQAASAKQGDQVILGVRPEDFIDGGGGDATIVMVVDVTEHLGGTTFLYGDIEGKEGLVAEASGDNRSRPGERVNLGISAARCHLFNSDGGAFRRLETAKSK